MLLNNGFYKFAWGVIEGCTNDCWYCYAKNKLKDIHQYTFREDLLEEPYYVDPARIFVNYLGDIMLAPESWVNRVLQVCNDLPDHTFIFMSKVPVNYERYEFSDNCILGVTVESPKEWHRAEIMERYTNRKMCSIEPILGNFKGKDFSQFEFVVIGCLIGSLDHENYDTVKHEKIYYTR